MEAHAAAEVFAEMNGAEFEQLKMDIANHGLIEPIWVFEGMILDGRARYRACQQLGIEPTFRTYTGIDPFGFAWSLNAERHKLECAQRAAYAADMVPQIQQLWRRQQLAGILSRVESSAGRKSRLADEAARIVGVGATNVHYSRTVKKQSPALFAKIKSGELSVKAAYRLLKHDPQRRFGAHGQAREVRIEEIRQLVNQGHRREQIAALLNLSEEHVGGLARAGGITLPDIALGSTHRINVHRVLQETVVALEGLALGLQTINGARLDLAPHEAQEWAQSMSSSLRTIGRLRKTLQRMSSHDEHEQ